MIFVPLFKTRQEEMRVSKDLNNCFSANIMPLYEILDEIYKPRYKKDPVTGDYIYEKKNKTRRKIKIEPLEEDIITLDKLNEIVDGNYALLRDELRPFQTTNYFLLKINLNDKLNTVLHTVTFETTLCCNLI